MQSLETLIQDLFTFQNMAMLAFFTVAIWFNYRAGFKHGIAWGADTTLSVLESENIIVLEQTNNGDFIIRSGDENKSKII